MRVLSRIFRLTQVYPRVIIPMTSRLPSLINTAPVPPLPAAYSFTIHAVPSSDAPSNAQIFHSIQSRESKQGPNPSRLVPARQNNVDWFSHRHKNISQQFSRYPSHLLECPMVIVLYLSSYRLWIMPPSDIFYPFHPNFPQSTSTRLHTFPQFVMDVGTISINNR